MPGAVTTTQNTDTKNAIKNSQKMNAKQPIGALTNVFLSAQKSAGLVKYLFMSIRRESVLRVGGRIDRGGRWRGFV